MIPFAILDTFLEDIHGAAFPTGLAVASAWLLRERARLDNTRSV